jgi:hypothetical protein
MSELQYTGQEGARIARDTNPWIRDAEGHDVDLIATAAALPAGTLVAGTPEPNDCECAEGMLAGVRAASDTEFGVQTCDACVRYDSDLDATAALAAALGPGFTVWFEPDETIPGECFDCRRPVKPADDHDGLCGDCRAEHDDND